MDKGSDGGGIAKDAAKELRAILSLYPLPHDFELILSLILSCVFHVELGVLSIRVRVARERFFDHRAVAVCLLPVLG